MESLLQALRIHLGDSALASAAFVALTALTVFAFSLGLSALGLGLVDPMRRRLKRLAGVERDDTSRAESIAALLQPLSAYILPKKDWDRS